MVHPDDREKNMRRGKFHYNRKGLFIEHRFTNIQAVPMAIKPRSPKMKMEYPVVGRHEYGYTGSKTFADQLESQVQERTKN